MTSVTSHVPSPISNDLASSPSDWHNDFLEMLPHIERHARMAFRDRKGEARDEAVQETVCNACVVYARLAKQGRAGAATWSSLAKYAIRQVRDGRRVGGSLNIKDVTSDHCQLRKQVKVQPLCRWDEPNQEWQEMLVEDKTCTPAELAASRIDFPAFLAALQPKKRRIAETLATGESTQRVAKLFGITPGRISQLRQELLAAWQSFHGFASAESGAA